MAYQFELSFFLPFHCSVKLPLFKGTDKFDIFKGDFSGTALGVGPTINFYLRLHFFGLTELSLKPSAKF